MIRFLAPAAIIAALALSGCGGSSSSSSSSASSAPAPTSSSASSTASGSSPAGASTLAVGADPGGQLKFDKTSLSASAGKVTVNFKNSSPIGHNLTIASSSGAVLGATPTFQGGTKSVSVTLKAGTYTFYCSVPGHREAGMQGTLVVK